MTASQVQINRVHPGYTNYVAYLDPTVNQPRIGHLNLEEGRIQPLNFASGARLSNLYEVIEIGEAHVKPHGETVALSSVELLAPIGGRDILAVGKNYAEHAKEFNSSGFDSSDKVDQPTHPVIFTKRSTSIIASGESIYAHSGFTQSADYEGEIGVIIGKAGFKIREEDAMSHVWGYTNINDMTARERQRDHKQFYIGKSPDTYCPMGPIAVPAHKLPKVLRIQTRVNGEERQNATIEDLIFSIPFLIKTLSEGQTLQPGDVIATGTPAGVGIGKKPPVFLKSGDVIEVSTTGLGTLKNTIATSSADNYTFARLQALSCVPKYNANKIPSGTGLTSLNSKQLYYRQFGSPSGPAIIFIHGLGGSSEIYAPLITTLDLESTHSIHLLDLEGHGLSPTSAASEISVESYASDFYSLVQHAKIYKTKIIAHSLGCLVALTIANKYPDLVSDLILMGPPASPLPEVGKSGSIARAQVVREKGISAVVDGIVTAGTSVKTKSENLIAIVAIRMSLLGQDPEGYAKGCTALAGVQENLAVENIKARTLIISGEEDKVSPAQVCEKLARSIPNTKIEILPQVGHWHLFEDLDGVSKAISSFIK